MESYEKRLATYLEQSKAAIAKFNRLHNSKKGCTVEIRNHKEGGSKPGRMDVFWFRHCVTHNESSVETWERSLVQ